MENTVDNLDELEYQLKHKDGIGPAEWRWIGLNGYIFTGKNCWIWGPEGKKYELTAGIRCMNCHSMVYYDKCPNDECYNFYMYTNYKHIKELDHLFWEMLYRQNPHLKEDEKEGKKS